MNVIKIVFMFSLVGLCFKSLDFSSLREKQADRSIDSIQEHVSVQEIEDAKQDFLDEFESLYANTETSLTFESYHRSPY